MNSISSFESLSTISLSGEEENRLDSLHQAILAMALGDGGARERVEQICRLAESMLPKSVATVLLLDDTGELQPFAAPSVPPEAQERLRGLRPGEGMGSCGTAIHADTPVYVFDTQADPRWANVHDVAIDLEILSCWSTPVRDSDGQPIGSFALSSFVHRAPGIFERLLLNSAAHAITLILQKRTLLETRNLQLLALANVTEGVLIADHDGRTQYCNAAFTQITGYSLEEMRGRNCNLLQGPATDPRVNNDIAQALAVGEVFRGEILNYRKDGRPFWNALSIVPIRNEVGQITHFVGTQRDITTLKQQETELQIAAQAFEVEEGIIITDAKQRIVRVNRAFSRLTGYSPEEILGKTPAVLHSGRQDRDFYAKMWAQIRKEGVWRGEIWNRRKNGEIYPESLTITAIRSTDGTVQNYVAHFQDISERKIQEDKLRYLALYDTLTTLPNRTLFAQMVDEAMNQETAQEPLARTGEYVAVGLLDLDGFKEINDTLGHEAGDELLRRLGQRFARHTRKNEGMARLGGDEFGFVILVNAQEELAALSQRLLVQVHEVAQEFSDVPVSASIGWAMTPEDGTNYSELLAHADEAMYAAKSAGKSTFRFYRGKVRQESERRIQVHRSVPLAIAAGDINYFLQPQLDLASGRVDGVEVLARWRQPNGRWLFPGRFMPIVEEDTHLVRSMGIHVLSAAQTFRKQLQNAGLSLNLSVNIGGRHFLHPEFLHDVAEFCPDGEGVTIEVTESAALRDLTSAEKIAHQLKERDFRLSMDDFGTGYSSLRYLTEIPFDEVKLDQNFVRRMDQCVDSLAVAGSAVLLANLNGKSLIAEGVARPEQLRLWMRLGGQRIQGYLLSPPLPLQAFLSWHSWLFLGCTKSVAAVPSEHIALLLLESRDFTWRHQMAVDRCPVSRWLAREEGKYGHLPAYQTIARLHPILHQSDPQQSDKLWKNAVAELREAAEVMIEQL